MEIIEIYLFVIGCCIGSFINVLIYRLPLNQSIVYPNSSCPECNAKIKWFDNLPIISWLLLRGKCRACKSKISFSYPIIELSTGLLVWLNFYANPTIYSQLAQATPALANRLIKIALDDKTRGYTCVSAIQTAFSILQSGVIDRENKSKLKKLREAMERIEGEPTGIIDI